MEKEIKIEWDILAAVSDRCLAGMANGFLEREQIKSLETPASMTWRLWTRDLGEFGTLEIRKIRAGWSSIHFSGIGRLIATGLSNEQIEIKKRHMYDVIDSYFSMLSQENIFIDDASTAADQSAGQENPEIKKINKLVNMWIERGWIRQKGYNLSQWLLDNDAPDTLSSREFNRHMRKMHKNGDIDKDGGGYKPKKK